MGASVPREAKAASAGRAGMPETEALGGTPVMEQWVATIQMAPEATAETAGMAALEATEESLGEAALAVTLETAAKAETEAAGLEAGSTSVAEAYYSSALIWHRPTLRRAGPRLTVGLARTGRQAASVDARRSVAERDEGATAVPWA